MNKKQISSSTFWNPPPCQNLQSKGSTWLWTQGRHHQKSKSRVPVSHKKDLCPPKLKIGTSNLAEWNASNPRINWDRQWTIPVGKGGTLQFILPTIDVVVTTVGCSCKPVTTEISLISSKKYSVKKPYNGDRLKCTNSAGVWSYP